MAKVSFTKLGLVKNQAVKNIVWNEQNIEIKQYLPINEKLELITNVLNSAHDEKNFSNPVKVEIFKTIEILYAYTNINFTEKQKEDIPKLYDLITSSGLFDTIKDNIPSSELDMLDESIYVSIDAIYTYQNSVMGILDTISQDYTDLDFNASDIQSKLADPKNIELLRGILTKLG